MVVIPSTVTQLIRDMSVSVCVCVFCVPNVAKKKNQKKELEVELILEINKKGIFTSKCANRILEVRNILLQPAPGRSISTIFRLPKGRLSIGKLKTTDLCNFTFA